MLNPGNLLPSRPHFVAFRRFLFEFYSLITVFVHNIRVKLGFSNVRMVVIAGCFYSSSNFYQEGELLAILANNNRKPIRANLPGYELFSPLARETLVVVNRPIEPILYSTVTKIAAS